MDSLNSSAQTPSSEPISRFLMLGVNPDIGVIRRTTIREAGRRPRTTFQSDQDKDITRNREVYRRERLAERDERWGQLASDPEHSTALNVKECVLEVYALYVQQLAAEENHMKGVAKILGTPTVEFEKNRKEVERVIEALWSQERTLNHSSDAF